MIWDLQTVISYFFRHAIGIAEEYFTEYACDKQDFMESDERINNVLALIKDEDLRQQILRDYKKVEAKNSRERWVILKKRVQDWQGKVMEEIYFLV